jgi:hypothetical protein
METLGEVHTFIRMSVALWLSSNPSVHSLFNRHTVTLLRDYAPSECRFEFSVSQQGYR